MTSMRLLDLRLIKDVPMSGRLELPVSITLNTDGTSHVVSRYSDNVWELYTGIPQDNLTPSHKRIRWRISLPDGSVLTDPQHAGLLESSKAFIWSLFVSPVEGRSRPTMLTLRSKFDNLVPLLNWMVSQGLTRFEQLANRALNYVPVASVGKSGKAMVASTITHRLLVVEDLYHQRDKLQDALLVHPWPHESAALLAGEKQDSAHRKPKTDLIPDTVACRLVDVALDYVRNRSVTILKALNESMAALAISTANGDGKGKRWAARATAARKAGFDGTFQLSSERLHLRTACYIIIDIFSGIRDSEMMSIETSCISKGITMDGSTNAQWLHGTRYKTGEKPHRWLVPSVVKEAVDVLTHLTEPFRRTLGQEEAEVESRLIFALAKERDRLLKRLYTLRKQKEKLFLRFESGAGGDGIGVLSGASMNQLLKRFCKNFEILGGDGKPYSLYAHQFRRTYAYFMARSELGDLITLRDHFGHWSIDMTALYADGGADEYAADIELIDMITVEKIGRQNEIMGSYLDSDTPLANGGHWLKDWRSLVRTAPNKETLIAEYAGTITLNGTGHSWCVGNAKGTGCGGLCVFEAQMCVDCNYGIIGQEHRPVWEGIRDQQQEALALDDMGPGGRARAQQILDYANKVLRRLDGQEAV